MTDVVEIARNRRSRLAAEIVKLDEFIRTAEVLIKYGDGFEGSIVSPNDLKSKAAGGIKATPDVDAAKPSVRVDRVGDGTTKSRTDASEPAATTEVSNDESDGKGEDVDHFDFAVRASRDDGELVLTGENADVDASIGQRLRHRRWMIGMTKKQLADRIGGDVAEIEKYERGYAPIATSCMWKLGGALGVPMSYFFEKGEGRSPDAGETRRATSSPGDTNALAQSA